MDGRGNLHCTLTVTSLVDTSPDIALSYRWGDQPAEHSIYVNGDVFWVQQNVLDFLQRLQRTGALSAASVFADAICINQTDPSEKVAQVDLMGVVYRQAKRVIIWLGSLPAQKSSATDWDVVSNAYWTRLWIVQEVILAQELTIWIGDFECSPADILSATNRPSSGTVAATRLFDYISVIASTTSARGNTWSQLLRQITPQSVDAHQTSFLAGAILQRTDEWRLLGGGEAPSLKTGLTIFGAQKASKVHDKVFGLRGIVQTRIRRDYDMPVTELYVRVLVEGFVELREQAKPITRSDWRRLYLEASQYQSICLAALGMSIIDSGALLVTYRALQRCDCIPPLESAFERFRYVFFLAEGTTLWYRYLLVYPFRCLCLLPLIIALSFFIWIFLLTARRLGEKLDKNAREDRSFEDWVHIADAIVMSEHKHRSVKLRLGARHKDNEEAMPKWADIFLITLSWPYYRFVMG